MKEQAESVLQAVKTLWQKGFLAAGDGNFSFKDQEGQIWITPSGGRKVDLKVEDFVEISSSKSSSESLMHKKVFERAPQAKVVFHAHPTSAIAYSVTQDSKFLPDDVISELLLSAGEIPIVDYARPGSAAMGDHLVPFLPQSRVFVLKHHGALSWGETVSEALNGMERLEHSCEIFLKASQFGEMKRLSSQEVEWLKAKRKELGEKIL